MGFSNEVGQYSFMRKEFKFGLGLGSGFALGCAAALAIPPLIALGIFAYEPIKYSIESSVRKSSYPLRSEEYVNWDKCWGKQIITIGGKGFYECGARPDKRWKWQ